jgi:sterol desaturase/sphingolipid hydroxylase (fatty acid hydroxylase superfamily)
MAMKERLLRFRSFWIFPILAGVLLSLSLYTQPDTTPAMLLWLIPAGLFLWTLIEYGLHRFAFHPERRDTTFREMLSASHLRHHADPRDPDKVLVRTPFALGVSALLYVPLYAMSGDLFMTAGLMTGIWAGFLYYELVHYRVHCTSTNSGFIARQRRRHFHHHFAHPERCFGVTTPLWDVVFGTGRAKHGQPAEQE